MIVQTPAGVVVTGKLAFDSSRPSIVLENGEHVHDLEQVWSALDGVDALGEGEEVRLVLQSAEGRSLRARLKELISVVGNAESGWRFVVNAGAERLKWVESRCERAAGGAARRIRGGAVNRLPLRHGPVGTEQLTAERDEAIAPRAKGSDTPTAYAVTVCLSPMGGTPAQEASQIVRDMTCGLGRPLRRQDVAPLALHLFGVIEGLLASVQAAEGDELLHGRGAA